MDKKCAHPLLLRQRVPLQRSITNGKIFLVITAQGIGHGMRMSSSARLRHGCGKG